MVSGRAAQMMAGALLALSACRGESNPRKVAGVAAAAGHAPAGSGGAGAEGGAPEETGGSAGRAATGGTTAVGGASADAGTGGTSGGGAGGLASSAGSAGAGAAGGRDPIVPGESEREREILGPLGTDDATIDATSGAELIDLAQEVSMARGYAMCRCLSSPDGPPEDVEQMLESCAREESGIRYLAVPDQARCVEEGSAVVAGFDEALRCQLKWVRDDGHFWAGKCTAPDTPWMPGRACDVPQEVTTLVDECQLVMYCANDERTNGQRCDMLPQCADQSDELGCFETRGHDWFFCDPELVYAPEICSYEVSCGLEKEPPVCDPELPQTYLCNDGGSVNVNVVCDRAADCADGSDERYCFK